MESAAITLLETFLPIRRQPPGELRKVLDVTLPFLNAWSFSGRDRIEKMDSHAPTKKRGVLNFLVRF